MSKTGTKSAMGWAVLPARVALGGLFIFAAVLKLSNPKHFAQAIAAFKVIPKDAEHLTIVSAFMVPWIEITAGLLLLLGLWARSAALVIGTMLVAFMGMMGSVLYRGLDVHCSCFGKFEWPCEGPIGTCHLIRNGVLLVLVAMVMVWGPGPLAVDRESTK